MADLWLVRRSGLLLLQALTQASDHAQLGDGLDQLGLGLGIVDVSRAVFQCLLGPSLCLNRGRLV